MKKPILRVIMILLLCVLGGCAGENVVPTPTPIPTEALTPTTKPVENPTPTIGTLPTNTPTVAPTEEPTEAPTITEAPITEIPPVTEEPTPTETPVVTVEPTEVPTATPEPTVTETPVITVAPTETVIPTVTPTSTPAPSPLPTATSTPIPSPTPIVSVDVEPEHIFQVGDNVYFKYYDGATLLVVSGTGSTWDYKESPIWGFDTLGWASHATVKTIIIEEGITRIGNFVFEYMTCANKVVFPNSLKEIGECSFKSVGSAVNYKDPTATVTWVNLDLTKIKTTSTSFYGSRDLEDIEGSASVMATPTPTPSPTPTPLPNPNNPKKVGESSVTSSVKIEYWDNGYLVYTGKGEVCETMKTAYPDNYLMDYLPDYYKKENKFHTVVFEEGITKITDALIGYFGVSAKITTVYLPKSLSIDSCGLAKGLLLDEGQTLHWYYNGKPFTATFTQNTEALNQAKQSGMDYFDSNYMFKDLVPILKEMLSSNTKVYVPEVREFITPIITIEWKE